MSMALARRVGYGITMVLTFSAGESAEPARVFESAYSEPLSQLAQQHADCMASRRTQGHQGWAQRREQALQQTGLRQASEICAESWPEQENSTEAQLWDEMVLCWRQSPGHWSVARRRWAAYGLGLAKGRNRIWYACIIAADP
jgi:uncharacterized protein YkwD